MRRLVLFLFAFLMVAPINAAAQLPASSGAILIYSGTTGYRHDSIPAGIKAVSAIAARRGLTVVASEDPTISRFPLASAAIACPKFAENAVNAFDHT